MLPQFVVGENAVKILMTDFMDNDALQLVTGIAFFCRPGRDQGRIFHPSGAVVAFWRYDDGKRRIRIGSHPFPEAFQGRGGGFDIAVAQVGMIRIQV